MGPALSVQWALFRSRCAPASKAVIAASVGLAVLSAATGGALARATAVPVPGAHAAPASLAWWGSRAVRGAMSPVSPARGLLCTLVTALYGYEPLSVAERHVTGAALADGAPARDAVRLWGLLAALGGALALITCAAYLAWAGVFPAAAAAVVPVVRVVRVDPETGFQMVVPEEGPGWGGLGAVVVALEAVFADASTDESVARFFPFSVAPESRALAVAWVLSMLGAGDLDLVLAGVCGALFRRVAAGAWSRRLYTPLPAFAPTSGPASSGSGGHVLGSVADLGSEEAGRPAAAAGAAAVGAAAPPRALDEPSAEEKRRVMLRAAEARLGPSGAAAGGP